MASDVAVVVGELLAKRMRTERMGQFVRGAGERMHPSGGNRLCSVFLNVAQPDKDVTWPLAQPDSNLLEVLFRALPELGP